MFGSKEISPGQDKLKKKTRKKTLFQRKFRVLWTTKLINEECNAKANKLRIVIKVMKRQR